MADDKTDISETGPNAGITVHDADDDIPTSSRSTTNVVTSVTSATGAATNSTTTTDRQREQGGNGGDGDLRGADPGTPLYAAREKFTRVADDLKGRYERATGGFQRKAKDARSELQRGAERARERYDEAGERLRHGYDSASEHAEEWNRDLNHFVQEHPGRAVLMAAGVGFLLGMVFRRRG
jgi:ElaB/YqjD/DUF883 family membrane-anchored ribosome-binding protein